MAEAGLLLSEVRAVKEMGSNHFVLVDAGFNDLMRPALYGSYHGISLFRRDGAPPEPGLRPTVVAGPLCESGDVFTQHDGGAGASRAPCPRPRWATGWSSTTPAPTAPPCPPTTTAAP